MRQIHGHKVNPANDAISIAVTDAVGAGGANHRYEITGFNTSDNQSVENPDDMMDKQAIRIPRWCRMTTITRRTLREPSAPGRPHSRRP